MTYFSHNLYVAYYLDELGRRRATSLLGIFRGRISHFALQSGIFRRGSVRNSVASTT